RQEFGHAGIVDEDGDRSQRTAEFGERRLNLGATGYVRTKRDRLAAGCRDFVHGISAARFIQIEHADGVAVPGETHGACASDPCSGSGYKCDFLHLSSLQLVCSSRAAYGRPTALAREI